MDKMRELIGRMRAAVCWRKGIAPRVVAGWADEFEAALAASPSPDSGALREALEEVKICSDIGRGGWIISNRVMKLVVAALADHSRTQELDERLQLELARKQGLYRCMEILEQQSKQKRLCAGNPNASPDYAEVLFSDANTIEQSAREMERAWYALAGEWKVAQLATLASTPEGEAAAKCPTCGRDMFAHPEFCDDEPVETEERGPAGATYSVPKVSLQPIAGAASKPTSAEVSADLLERVKEVADKWFNEFYKKNPHVELAERILSFVQSETLKARLGALEEAAKATGYLATHAGGKQAGETKKYVSGWEGEP